MAGILQFALGLENGNFLSNLLKADTVTGKFFEHLKGHGGKGTELFETLTKGVEKFKQSGGGAEGFGALAAELFTAEITAKLVEEGLREVLNVIKEIGMEVVNAGENGAQLFYQAARTQTSVAGLYKLQEAYKAVGLDGESANQNTLRLQKALSGITEMGESTAASFARLGLSMASMRRLAPEEQMSAVAEALAKMDKSSRAGVASKIFGREGFGNMMQIVGQVDTFREAMERADPGGRAMAQIAESFAQAKGDAVELKAEVEVMFASIAKYLVIPFQNVMDDLKDIDWRGIGEDLGLVLWPIVHGLADAADLLAFVLHPLKWLEHFSAQRERDAQMVADAPEGSRLEAFFRMILQQLTGIPFLNHSTFAQGAAAGPDQVPYVKPQLNQFEKIGFLMNSSVGPNDYNKRTAAASEQTNVILNKILATAHIKPPIPPPRNSP